MKQVLTSPWMTLTVYHVKCLYFAKVAPAKQDVHMEDVHRAGWYYVDFR